MANFQFQISAVPQFAKPQTEKNWFWVIQKEVLEMLQRADNRAARRILWAKAAILAAAFGISLAQIFLAKTIFGLIAGFVFSGIFLVLAGFNFAHDAAHGSIFKEKKWNAVVFEMIFGLLGANGYLWKQRHLHAHHPFPNLQKFDADMETQSLIRLSPHEKWLPRHRFQHFYAPVLYSFYTLIWVFFKDFALFFGRQHGHLFPKNHPKSAWAKLILGKTGYLFLFLVLPVLATDFSIFQIGTAFFAMHLVQSQLLLWTFLMSHHVENSFYPTLNQAGNLSDDWATHQIKTAVDFHALRPAACHIFGGFNCHVAHHLFPTVSHVFYPKISQIIYRNLAKTGLQVQQVSWWGGMISHWKLLRRAAQNHMCFTASGKL